MSSFSRAKRILDENTLINISLIAKLLARYKYLSIAAVVLSIGLSLSLYHHQADRYWSSIRFTNLKDNSSSPMEAVSIALGGGNKERHGTNVAEEIKTLRSSMDFTRKVVEKILVHEDFEKLDFNKKITKTDKFTVPAIRKSCEENNVSENCLFNFLIKALPMYYTISDPSRSGLNFVLEVGTTNELTTNVLLNTISLTIKELREESIQMTFTEQRIATENLVQQKREELEKNKYQELLKNEEILQNQISTLQLEIETQNKLYLENKSSMNIAEAKLKKVNKAIKKGINRKQLGRDKKRHFLRQKIENLTKDINALEFLATDHSVKEKDIIYQLKKERRSSERALKKLGSNKRSVAYFNDFLSKTNQKFGESELNYSVYKEYAEKAKFRYSELLKDNWSLLEKMLKLKTTLAKLRPSVEFLKALEAKVIQLRLMEITSTSDLKFDKFAAVPSKTKKIGKLMIFVYGFVLTVFTLCISLFLRFIFDDRIHDEDDLKRIFANIEIVGVAPSFKK